MNKHNHISLPELRRAMGKTQADIAQALNVGQDVVSRMERTRGLRMPNLRRYLAALGVSCEVKVRIPGRGDFIIKDDGEEKIPRTNGRSRRRTT